MLELDLRVTGATDVGLSVVGEIFRQPLAPDAAPVVTQVIARSDRSARFRLAEGAYEYQFAVDLGEGEFVLSLHLAGAAAAIAAHQFSTADGFDGRVFRFVI